MQFGISLPTYPQGATAEGAVAVAQAAERLGFASAWVTDHVLMQVDDPGPYGSILEPLQVLAYLAALTERVRLGTSVIVVPQRNGIVLAKELATLDVLSKGRLIAGVGAGWNAKEFAALGYGERFSARGRWLDETLAVWRHLWTTPERPYESRFYHLPAVAFGPLPVRAGGPPIWIGGDSEAALRRTARVAEAWHPVNILAGDVAEKAAILRRFADEAGRPMPIIAPRLSVQWGTTFRGPVSASGARALRADSAAELAERLRAYQQAGASEIILHFGSPDGDEVVAAMERFMAEVGPEIE